MVRKRVLNRADPDKRQTREEPVKEDESDCITKVIFFRCLIFAFIMMQFTIGPFDKIWRIIADREIPVRCADFIARLSVCCSIQR